MSAAATELRIALIAALTTDAGVQAAMGASPRIMNRIPPKTPFPYITIDTSSARPWDTTTDRGKEITVELRLMGEYEGDKQGEDIFAAIDLALRDWAPRPLTDHHLVNLTLSFADVRSEEDGKRYFGLMSWRAVTEEAASVFVAPSAPATPSLAVEEEERQTRLAAAVIVARRGLYRASDGRVAHADKNSETQVMAFVGISEAAAAASGDPVNIRTAGVMVDAAWSWTTGEAIFLGVDGALSHTAPTSGFLLRVGTALSATSIFIRPEPVVSL